MLTGSVGSICRPSRVEPFGYVRLPVPARLKEWAYAGFAIDLASALIAHLSVGDGPEAWGWAAGTGVLWGVSYFFWRRLQATPASA